MTQGRLLVRCANLHRIAATERSDHLRHDRIAYPPRGPLSTRGVILGKEPLGDAFQQGSKPSVNTRLRLGRGQTGRGVHSEEACPHCPTPTRSAPLHPHNAPHCPTLPKIAPHTDPHCAPPTLPRPTLPNTAPTPVLDLSSNSFCNQCLVRRKQQEQNLALQWTELILQVKTKSPFAREGLRGQGARQGEGEGLRQAESPG